MAPNGEQSLIDYILSESSTSYVCETICPLGNSDHAGITLSIRMCHNGAGANKKSLEWSGYITFSVPFTERVWLRQTTIL